jgi:hypothetical protein
MKVVIYTAEIGVPFDEFYKPLGSWNKIIFSNKKQFDENAVKSILEVIDFENKETMFFVPLEMKNMFFKLLQKFFKIELEEEKNKSKQSVKNSLGPIWEKFSQFYDKLEVIEVFNMSQTKESSKESADLKECADLLDKIVSNNNDNSIDAIFVYDVINKVMLCQTENSAKPGTLLKYNLKSIVKSFGSINNGGLKRDILEFDDGIVISYIVKNPLNSPKAIIGFITTVKEDGILGKLVSFSNKDFDVLKKKCC